MNSSYNKEVELKERFNQFITEKITGLNADYYSRLSIEEFEDIKTALKDIHNIITYKTTIRFIEWLSERFLYVKENNQLYFEQVLRTKPNDNGYDLVVSGEVKIIAEIKCNKPINNGYKFGSAQKKGLIKDITGLLEGKSKVKSIDPKAAFKFLVIYDFGDYTLSAVHHLIKNLNADLKEKVTIYDGQPFIKDKVYIVLIK
ncbi:hypothetical protein J41TS12_06170 [Paenibacillus antibioticophila]|uniref:Restriction endonuclease n=1 Tax=Paenibacillus antibioticophila TaxID=1274374 RepID=A0A920CDE2_9BACL|nr:hypothetical protein [Paenibacillus antibioticophila]GIO35756.1 hypothetical protein J41TS12_06170 [Paenibacillus antibioticophila]